MDIETSNDLIEEILATWKDRIGDDYPGYRGHIYRMFNFCQALRLCSEEEKTKLAIAACHHDIGLWSAHTVDYIPPFRSGGRGEALPLRDGARSLVRGGRPDG